MITLKTGNIFTTQCQTIVNTVNCVGIMGAGIAFEFRLRHPAMFIQYQQYCINKQIDIGKLWVYPIPQDQAATHYQKILNFPTKYDWKNPSKKAYLEKGLQNFVASYKKRGIDSIAFPMLGADKGGIDAQESLSIMHSHLESCAIDIEIWKFDPSAKDDLYHAFEQFMLTTDDSQIKAQSGMRIDAINKIRQGLQQDNINSLSGLLTCQGIGEKTLEKAFTLMLQKKDKTNNNQLTLSF